MEALYSPFSTPKLHVNGVTDTSEWDLIKHAGYSHYTTGSNRETVHQCGQCSAPLRCTSSVVSVNPTESVVWGRCSRSSRFVMSRFGWPLRSIGGRCEDRFDIESELWQDARRKIEWRTEFSPYLWDLFHWHKSLLKITDICFDVTFFYLLTIGEIKLNRDYARRRRYFFTRRLLVMHEINRVER